MPEPARIVQRTSSLRISAGMRSTKFPAPLKNIVPDKSLGTQGGMTKL